MLWKPAMVIWRLRLGNKNFLTFDTFPSSFSSMVNVLKEFSGHCGGLGSLEVSTGRGLGKKVADTRPDSSGTGSVGPQNIFRDFLRTARLKKVLIALHHCFN